MDFIDQVISYDISLLKSFNDTHTPLLDSVMILLSHKFSAIPLYAFLLFMFYKKHGIKSFLLSLPVITLMIIMADQGASGFAKPYFERLRPCKTLEIFLPDGCGGQYGFFSSHASNTFAVAVFFTLTVFKENKKIGWSLLIWSTLVSISRIYLGAHYPSDVLVGGVYGSLCAVVCTLLFQKLDLRFIKS